MEHRIKETRMNKYKQLREDVNVSNTYFPLYALVKEYEDKIDILSKRYKDIYK